MQRSTISFQIDPEARKETDERIEIPLHRTISTHKYCCICSAINNLTVVPQEARMQSYIKMGIYVWYIPGNNRCCRSHLIKQRFFDEDINLLKVHSNSTRVSPSELTKMMQNLTIKCDATLYDQLGKF